MADAIEPLYALVTEAIGRAQWLPEGDARRAAYAHVADLEERIAALAAAGTTDGDVARLGAVYAAMKAGAPGRARALALRYVEEPMGECDREGLQALLIELAASTRQDA